MKFFQYKEDRRPVLIFTLYLFVDFAAYLYIDNIYLLILWFAIGIIPKANIAALVCKGRILPKLVYAKSKFHNGNAICKAARTPTSIPTTPQRIVA